MVDVEKMLGNVSGTLVGGFGDRIVIGILVRLLDNVTAEKTYEAILSNNPLFDKVPDEDWEHWKERARNFHMMEITNNRVRMELTKYRPDIMGMVINVSGGNEWLDRQITYAKQKLGI